MPPSTTAGKYCANCNSYTHARKNCRKPDPVRHRMFFVVGHLTQPTGIAVCGALRALGARFTPYWRLVTCKECRRLHGLVRASAKLRNTVAERRPA